MNVSNSNSKKNNLILFLIVIISLAVILQTSLTVWYFFFKDNKDSSINTKDNTIDDNYFGLGEKFTFDDLEITVGNRYTLLRLDNQYSSYNNKIVVRLPITIKNNKQGNYMLNIYDYKILGPLNNELDEVAGYFNESLFYADELEPDKSYLKYLYFLYDSNGNYTIQFNNGYEKKAIVFNIENKGDIKSYEEIKKKEHRFITL